MSDGWIQRCESCDEGGAYGGHMDRQASKPLLAVIMAGEIDHVVVYKTDRLNLSPGTVERPFGIFRFRA